MKKLSALLFALMALLLTGSPTTAQIADSKIVKGNMSQTEIDRIVRAFSAKETEFRQALNNYSFRRDATIQTIGMGGQVSGEFRRQSTFIFDNSGRRYERVLLAPVATLTDVRLTPEDLEDLGGVNQFPLEPGKIPQYKFDYVGKEKVDELNLHVFDVAPKVLPDPKKSKERLFLGRIWVDDVDLQIVKSKGKGVPETKDNKFPVVETWRENVEGKFWFPTYAYANDELYFEKSDSTVRLKIKVTYTDYKEASATVTIIEDSAVEEPTPQPEKKP